MSRAWFSFPLRRLNGESCNKEDAVEDRRRDPRLRVALAGQFRLVGADVRGPATIEDISPGGARVLLSVSTRAARLILPRAILELTVQLVPAQSSIVAEGEILRSAQRSIADPQEDPPGPEPVLQLEIGLQFTQISTIDRFRILNFVQRSHYRT